MLFTLGMAAAEWWSRRRAGLVLLPLSAGAGITAVALPAHADVEWWRKRNGYADSPHGTMDMARQLAVNSVREATACLLTHESSPDDITPSFWNAVFTERVRWSDWRRLRRKDVLAIAAKTGAGPLRSSEAWLTFTSMERRWGKVRNGSM